MHIIRALAHALMAVVLIVVPALWLLPRPLWRLPLPTLVVLATLVVAYLAAALVLDRTSWPRIGNEILRAVVVSIAAFGVCVAVVSLLWWRSPRIFAGDLPWGALVTSALLGLVALVVTGAFRHGAVVTLLSAAVFTVAGSTWHAAYKFGWLPRPVPPSKGVSFVDTSLYPLQITTYSNWLPRSNKNGGGMSRWGSGYLIAAADGVLYLVNESNAGDSLRVEALPWKVPLNVDQFIEGAREVFKDLPSKGVESFRFRVAGVLVQERGDLVRIYVSHHFWNTSQRCYVLRVSYLEGTREQILGANSALIWRTFYETAPCLTLNTEGPRGVRFGGRESGGRMAMLNDNELLLSVGAHVFDGVDRNVALAQDRSNSYGKILRIELNTGTAEVYSSGHRNPQGLYVDPHGAIWETEHGPRGGDEINLIRRGVDYGWPAVTYGTDYSRHSWPLNPAQGRHDGFEEPIFAFVPSIGISSLTGIVGDTLKDWQGDLLVGSLRAQTIWRVRVTEGRAILTEPIPVGHRVRDILIAPDGRVVVWTDEGDLLFIEPAKSRSGDVLITQCTGCHGLNVWDPAFLAPNLARIVGRPVASRKDFEYSEAMREFGGRWTTERLDAFLADPQATVPGTSMVFPGIKDAEQRRQIISYLEASTGE